MSQAEMELNSVITQSQSSQSAMPMPITQYQPSMNWDPKSNGPHLSPPLVRLVVVGVQRHESIPTSSRLFPFTTPNPIRLLAGAVDDDDDQYGGRITYRRPPAPVSSAVPTPALFLLRVAMSSQVQKAPNFRFSSHLFFLPRISDLVRRRSVGFDRSVGLL